MQIKQTIDRIDNVQNESHVQMRINVTVLPGDYSPASGALSHSSQKREISSIEVYQTQPESESMVSKRWIGAVWQMKVCTIEVPPVCTLRRRIVVSANAVVR